MAIAFKGSFDVEDGDFTLDAQRFILRANDISFLFTGSDDDGAFKIEGIASKTVNNFYMAPKLEVNYHSYNSDDTASIKINSVSLSNKGLKCKVLGTWIQEGDAWSFSGTLSKFNA